MKTGYNIFKGKKKAIKLVCMWDIHSRLTNCYHYKREARQLGHVNFQRDIQLL